MDEEIERLVVSVRADTQGFSRDVAAMRSELEGPLASGIDKAGRLIETSLIRAIQTGKFGFEDLRRIALSVLSEIASAAIRSGIDSILGGGSGGGGGQGGSGGLLTSLASIAASVFAGSPGRATGGPVSPGRPYIVGERGPEWFVPTSSGAVVAGGSRTAQQSIQLTIHVSDNGRMSAPDALHRSSRQVARAVRRALFEAEG